MKKRITKQVRVELKWYEFAKKQSQDYGITISKIMGKALRYYSGEHKREKEEATAKYKALFPSGHKVRDPLNVSETQSAAELSTILGRLRGDNWLSRQNEDNDNNTSV